MQKRLFKSRTDKVLDGVCGGIAQYFEVDAVIIRLVWVGASILLGFGAFGILAYLIAMVIMPIEPTRQQTHKNMNDDNQAGDEDDFLFEPRSSSTDDQAKQEGYSSNNNELDYADSPYHQSTESRTERNNRFSLVLGYILISLGIYLLIEKAFNFRLHHWFNELQPYVWPVLIIILGVFLLTRRSR